LIISHEHRFIFLKTAKTAGTSIEIALSRYCGPADVITEISTEDEALRAELGFRGAQNFHYPLTHYRAEDWWRLARGRRRLLQQHERADRVRGFTGDDVFRDYSTLAFERNPWDRVISWYYWLRFRRAGSHKDPGPSLVDFLDSPLLPELKRKGWGIYTIDGEVAVDRVARYEDLEAELERFGETVGLPGPLAVPRTKDSQRSDRRHYREVLRDEDAEKIAKLFADEIALFGYEY
jgi:hypothetical protein